MEDNQRLFVIDAFATGGSRTKDQKKSSNRWLRGLLALVIYFFPFTGWFGLHWAVIAQYAKEKGTLYMARRKQAIQSTLAIVYMWFTLFVGSETGQKSVWDTLLRLAFPYQPLAHGIIPWRTDGPCGLGNSYHTIYDNCGDPSPLNYSGIWLFFMYGTQFLYYGLLTLYVTDFVHLVAVIVSRDTIEGPVNENAEYQERRIVAGQRARGMSVRYSRGDLIRVILGVLYGYGIGMFVAWKVIILYLRFTVANNLPNTWRSWLVLPASSNLIVSPQAGFIAVVGGFIGILVVVAIIVGLIFTRVYLERGERPTGTSTTGLLSGITDAVSRVQRQQDVKIIGG